MSEAQRNELNAPSGYLFLSEIPEDSTDRDCPKCGDCLSVNWKNGKPYIYCVEGCDLTVANFQDNKAIA